MTRLNKKSVRDAYNDFSLARYLNAEERDWLETQLRDYPDGHPSIRQMWSLLDSIWDECGCDPDNNADQRYERFYRHPVWLLNGLHIETDPESLAHRHAFADYVVHSQSKRVADFGGGFGGLARIIGSRSQEIIVEVIDPFPHPAAKTLVDKFPNVAFKDRLSAEYDVIIATDVYEHVHDPIGLFIETLSHLKPGGEYLIGNCFEPVIKCHLPCTFHLRSTWKNVMRCLGLQMDRKIAYASVFRKIGVADHSLARELEHRSRDLYKWTRWLPLKVQGPVTSIFI